jgi:hypothetical protein
LESDKVKGLAIRAYEREKYDKSLEEMDHGRGFST